MSKWMYTPELKAEIVTKLLTTNVSLNEIAREYNIDKGNISLINSIAELYVDNKINYINTYINQNDIFT